MMIRQASSNSAMLRCPAMSSMQGVSSQLIARNESWVRAQASALARRLPSNVEKADLIQVGLIAVAQAALGFKWEGDAESEEGKEAFVRYARMRVKGAMLDELRQMDRLGRGQRRQVKSIQIARERWLAQQGTQPTLAQLSQVCGLPVEEIAALEQAARAAQEESLDDDPDHDGAPRPHAATPQDEVEARVDTAIVLRHLEKFFAALPERERQVIDAYMGIGLSPTELAASLKLTPSRISRMYSETVQRIARHFDNAPQRALDRRGRPSPAELDAMIRAREDQLAAENHGERWGDLMERALTLPREQFGTANDAQRLQVGSSTRWG